MIKKKRGKKYKFEPEPAMLVRENVFFDNETKTLAELSREQKEIRIVVDKILAEILEIRRELKINREEHEQFFAELKRNAEEHEKIFAELRRNDEDRRKNEEAYRRNDEDHRKTEEAFRKNDEDHRKTEEAFRRNDEDHRKIEEAFRRNDEDHRKIKEAFRRNDEDHRKIEEAFRRNDEDHRRNEEAHKRNDEDHHRFDAAFRKNEEDHRKNEEDHKKIFEELKEIRGMLKQTNRAVSALGNIVGYSLEDLARIILPQWLKAEENILVHNIARKFIKFPGQDEVETNFIGKGTKNDKPIVVIGEAKVRTYRSEVNAFQRHLEKITPAYKGMQIYPFFVSYLYHDSAKAAARKYGIHLIESFALVKLTPSGREMIRMSEMM